MIRLSKAEGMNLAALLEEGAETPEMLAKAVIKRYWELLGERDCLWAGAMNIEGFPVVVGPVTTAKEVVKAAGDGVTIVQAYTPAGWKRHLASVDERPDASKMFSEVEKDRIAAKAGWRGKNSERQNFL